MTDDGLLRAFEMSLEAIKRGLEERAENLQPNQCPGCGAYRLDGSPPQVHEYGCPWAADALDRFVRCM